MYECNDDTRIFFNDTTSTTLKNLLLTVDVLGSENRSLQFLTKRHNTREKGRSSFP